MDGFALLDRLLKFRFGQRPAEFENSVGRVRPLKRRLKFDQKAIWSNSLPMPRKLRLEFPGAIYAPKHPFLRSDPGLTPPKVPGSIVSVFVGADGGDWIADAPDEVRKLWLTRFPV